MDITDIYEHCYIYKTDHILVDRASLNKYRKTEVTPRLLPEHRGPKLEINSSRNEQHKENWDKGRN